MLNSIYSATYIQKTQRYMYYGFFLRVLVAIWNGFFGPSFGAEGDAIVFHENAANFAAGLDIREYQFGKEYVYVLGMLYYVTTDSVFIGSFLSCLVWLVSAWLLIRIMMLLSFEAKHQFWAMLVYALLPSSILFMSVTLREPFQLLFVNLSIFSALKIFIDKSPMHWFWLLCAVAGAGLLHPTLYAFGVYIVCATLAMLSFRKGKKFFFTRLIVIISVIVVVGNYGVSSFISATTYNFEAGLPMVVETFQQGGLGYLGDARAFYKTSVEINGMSGLVSFIPVSLFQYLFEPMPWRISASLDLGLFLENILRGWLIWKSWIGLRSLPTKGRKPLLFIFLSYLVIETIWSIGTINWGTATRHHIPGMGLLIVSAFAFTGSRKVRVRRLRFSWVKN